MTVTLAGQLGLAGEGWRTELRDSRGRWTRGVPGPFNPAVRHLYQLLPQVDSAISHGLYDEPGKGTQAVTRIVTLPGGERVIDKSGEDRTDLDREELASYVAQAIGAPAPAVYRAAPHRILQEYVPGQVAARYFTEASNAGVRKAAARGITGLYGTEAGVQAEEDARDAIFATPEARAIADLDYLITNDDRHEYNWMVTGDGKPVAIDHGVVMFDGMPSDSEFVQRSDPVQRGSPALGFDLADQLHQVRAQFQRTGHLDWFNAMIETPVAQLIDPADTRTAEWQILEHWHDKYGDPFPWTAQPVMA